MRFVGSSVSEMPSSRSLLARFGFHNDAHNVALVHDEVLDVIDFDFRSGPLAEENPIVRLDIDRDEFPRLVTPAGADRDDLALLRFFLGGIRNDDALRGFRLGIETLDHESIVERTKFHKNLR
jgi:hypothetical protein